MRGEIDIRTAPELDHLLRLHLAELAPGEALVVDLTEVGHFSVAGLNVLQAVAATARERHRTVRISLASPQVDRVLRVCGVDAELSDVV